MEEMPLEVGQIEIWVESEEAFSKLLQGMNSVFGCHTGVVEPIKATRLQQSLCKDWDWEPNPPLPKCPWRVAVKIPEGAIMWILEAPSVENKLALYAFVSGWSHGRESPEPQNPNDRVCEIWARTGP